MICGAAGTPASLSVFSFLFSAFRFPFSAFRFLFISPARKNRLHFLRAGGTTPGTSYSNEGWAMDRRTAGTAAHPEERIIARLKQAAGGEVSGERLCAELGISRAAVWKHIQGLRDGGYCIDAAPRRGYSLRTAPDTPLATEVVPLLTTRLIGRPYHFLAATDSTNRQTAAYADAGATEGTVVAADAQTGGRGRMGRAWVSPPGLNAYVSILLMPAIEPARVTTLPLVAGLAVALTIERIAPGLRPLVKWPNDILLNGRKVCGILCEMEAEADRIRRVVCGIGVNLNQTTFPAELAPRATSLALESGTVIARAR
ncbi:MAG: biotin--[acetyl-CoA-carboxylase] ligase, partial [Lentisphaerae bacterium]|nr:biotin--[acetyl-CoA-carboxylase] ligase [Lentisphaerota bacterium]